MAKRIKVLFTEDEWGYCASILEGCINDSLGESDGVPSISKTKLKSLYKKITGETWKR